MKKSLIIFTVLIFSILFFNNAFAAWYIIGPDGIVKGTSSTLPNEQDLETRGEFAVFSIENYTLGETEYIGKKFKQRVKSSEEIAKIKSEEETAKVEKVIREKIREQAIVSLKSEGKLDANGKIVK
jgi:hypothetical protein